MAKSLVTTLLSASLAIALSMPTAAHANVPTPENELSDIELCKIKQHPDNFWATRAGFPQHPDYVINKPKLVIQLIYVDAKDLTSKISPAQDSKFWINGTGKFLNDMAEGKVKFEFRVANKYFRLPKPIASYGVTRAKQGDAQAFVQAAIDAADKQIDFTDVDFVIAVPPPNVKASQVDFSPAIPLEKSNPFRTDEGLVYRGTLAGQDTRWDRGHTLITHEMGHLLGLQDYYWYGWKPGMAYEKQFKFMGQFDNMNYAPDKAMEWIAWSRWLLGFIEDSQVRCVTNQSKTVHEITAVSTKSSSTKLVVIPLDDYSAIAVESRRNARHDSRTSSRNNGLLVYRIDTRKQSGFGPVEILRNKSSRDPYFADATLTPGESLTVGKVTIKNLKSTGNKDLAEISVKQN